MNGCEPDVHYEVTSQDGHVLCEAKGRRHVFTSGYVAGFVEHGDKPARFQSATEAAKAVANFARAHESAKFVDVFRIERVTERVITETKVTRETV